MQLKSHNVKCCVSIEYREYSEKWLPTRCSAYYFFFYSLNDRAAFSKRLLPIQYSIREQSSIHFSIILYGHKWLYKKLVSNEKLLTQPLHSTTKLRAKFIFLRRNSN